MQKITIKHNGKVISLESSDPAAGVPDTTQGAGPDLIQLQDDAKKEPTDPQAEFDAAVPATQSATETDDKPEEAGEKANESIAAFVKTLTPAQKKMFAGICSKESDEPEVPATPAEPAAPDAPATDEGGVGEVTQTANETVVEANGLTITIADDTAAAEPAEPAAPDAPAPAADPEPAASTDSADPNGDAAGAETSMESIFANLNLRDL